MTFESPPKYNCQKPILFGKVNNYKKKKNCVSFEEEYNSLEFSHYNQNAHKIMKKMGYDLAKGRRLNFEKEKRTMLQSFSPKGKMLDYYDRTSERLGYFTTP